MYSTCLFCNAHLGRNEAVEHFPIGRRLAYDAAKGRLWVVCRKCERWNLTPLETRWEAIEEAERLFRATKLRRTSDNIGLAEVREGTQLVRVGAPPPLEFAAWRYGDQFGRRWRRHLIVAGSGAIVGGAAMVVPFSGIFLPSLALWGAAAQFTSSAVSFIQRHRDNRARFAIRDGDGASIPLTPLNVRSAVLVVDPASGWQLKVTRGKRNFWRKGPAIRPGVPEGYEGMVTLTGHPAQRALSDLLPYLNRGGGSKRHVRDAVDAIGESADLGSLIRRAAANADARRAKLSLGSRNESNVATLPAPLRLALEMSVHASDEQRAMDGELAQLEERWRAAEEIAAISDSLLVTPDIEQKLDSMKR